MRIFGHRRQWSGPVMTPVPPVTVMIVYVPARQLYLKFLKHTFLFQNSVPFRSCSQGFARNPSTLPLAKLSWKTQLKTAFLYPFFSKCGTQVLCYHVFVTLTSLDCIYFLEHLSFPTVPSISLQLSPQSACFLQNRVVSIY